MIDLLLLAVAVVALFLLLTMIGNFVIRAPSLPTSGPVASAMAELAALQPGDRVYDLGAGDGRLLIAAKRRCPGVRAIGMELLPTIWLLGKLRILFSGTGAELRLGNLFRADLRDADVVFLYQIPSVIDRIMPKLARELRPGTRVVSHTFALPGRSPEREESVRGVIGTAVLRRYRW